jgi:hypothetical protein
MFPYVDDFLLFAAKEEEVLTLHQRLASLLDRLGVLRHPANGLWMPAQVGHKMGIDVDTTSSYLYAMELKLPKITRQARQLIGRATRDVRWLPVKELQSLAGKAQYLF